jgi:transposase
MNEETMAKAKLGVESERVDELPIILEFSKQMGVADAIDQSVGTGHGNRTGLSYGRLAWGLRGAIATQRDPRLNHVEAWAVAHRPTLQAARGEVVGDKDCTDDRLADLLWVVGDPEGEVGQALEQKVGPHLVRAYPLPTEVGRADTTSVSVYHHGEASEGLLAFGHRQERRPELRQFVAVLGTLDPAGVPLVTSTLAGTQAEAGVYWPTWQRRARIIGHPQWVFGGESKVHSAETVARIQRAGGWFLAPLPLKGHVPQAGAQGLKPAPRRPTPLYLPEAKGQRRVVGHGFVVERRVSWSDPETGEVVEVPERVFMVRRTRYKNQQLHDLSRRLERAEAALTAYHGKHPSDPAAFEAALRAIGEQHRVADFLSGQVSGQSEPQEKWLGRGRPGPQRVKQHIEHYRARVVGRRRATARAAFKEQAGWRPDVTNAPTVRLSLQQAVEKYAGQWQPEQGFHRLKGGLLQVAPIFLRTDRQMRGLRLRVTMVLRLLTLLEFVARRNLAAEGATVSGLYAGAPTKATARPTAERLLAAFAGITLYTMRIGNHLHHQLSPLTALHKQILQYLGLPLSVYTALETG